MTDPPQECPTRTTSPSARSIALLVAVTSSARDVVGFCTEITLYPWSTSGLITLLQEEPSAQSPWTKTIVGFVFMEALVCANAFELSDKTPTSNRVPIFFIHASNCIGKDCKYKHGGEFLARRSLSSPIIAGLLAKNNPLRDQSASLFRESEFGHDLSLAAGVFGTVQISWKRVEWA